MKNPAAKLVGPHPSRPPELIRVTGGNLDAFCNPRMIFTGSPEWVHTTMSQIVGRLRQGGIEVVGLVKRQPFLVIADGRKSI